MAGRNKYVSSPVALIVLQNIKCWMQNCCKYIQNKKAVKTVFRSTSKIPVSKWINCNHIVKQVGSGQYWYYILKWSHDILLYTKKETSGVLFYDKIWLLLLPPA